MGPLETCASYSSEYSLDEYARLAAVQCRVVNVLVWWRTRSATHLQLMMMMMMMKAKRSNGASFMPQVNNVLKSVSMLR